MGNKSIPNTDYDNVTTLSMRCATSVNTSSSIDAPVYCSASMTAALVMTTTSIPIGTVLETQANNEGGARCLVGMYGSMFKGNAGGTVTPGTRICVASSLTTMTNVAGTLTGVTVVGVALTAASVSGEKFLYTATPYSGVVIA
jgi:hypothetical protein